MARTNRDLAEALYERRSRASGEEYAKLTKELNDFEDKIAREYGINSAERISVSNGAHSNRYN